MVTFTDLLAGASPAGIARLISELAVKASLVLTAAAVLSWFLRRASAATRHLIWTSALVMVLALPLCSLVLPAWHVPLMTLAPVAETVAQSQPATPAPGDAASEISTSAARHSNRPQPLTGHLGEGPSNSLSGGPSASRAVHALGGPKPVASQAGEGGIDWIALLLAIWIGGAVLTILRLTLGVIGLWIVESRTRSVLSREWIDLTFALSRQLGLTRPVRLLQSRRATMPLSWGWVRPVVLLPVDATTWPLERRRIVLLHELAHVKRRDCLTQMLAQIVCAAYWFNPLVWFAASRLRAERERACDDLVLSAGTRGADYADHLLEIARAFRSGGFPSWATVAMAKPSQLEGRLLAILDPTRRRRAWPRWACAAAVASVAAVALPIAALQPWVGAQAAALANELPQAGDAQGVASGPQTEKPIGGVKGGVAGGVPGGVPGGIEDGVKGGLAEAVAGAIAEGVRGGIAGGLSGGVAGGIAGGVYGGVLAGVHSAGGSIAGKSDAMTWDPDDDRDAPQEMVVDRRVIDALVTALKDESKDVRQQAAEALGRIRDARAIDGLTVALRDVSPEVREQAASSLSHFKSGAASGALLLALKDQSAAVRREAVSGLARMRDANHVDALTMMLQDTDKEVRQHAATGLGQLRASSAIEPLGVALKDVDAEVRQQAAYALGQIRDPRTIPALIVAIADANREVRHQAVHALGQLRASAAVEPLIGALKDMDPDVRQQAAHALAEIRDPRAVNALMSALTDTHADVRQQAAYALARLRSATATPALITALSDKHKDVRQQAAYALSQIRDPRSVDALTNALRDPDADVRQQAAYALGQLARVVGKDR